MRNRWHGGGPTIEEEAEDCDELNEQGAQYRALNTTLELDLGESSNGLLIPDLILWFGVPLQK